MEISNEIVIYLLMFTLGAVVGIYIMTQVNSKQDAKLITNLLDLEDNMSKYKQQINQLIVDKRIAETQLAMWKMRRSTDHVTSDGQLVEIGKFLNDE